MSRARLLKPYLFRLARNVALNRIKKNKRMRERDHEVSHWLVSNGKCEDRDERIDRLEATLVALPEKQRTILILKFYRNKTFREIGEILGISENTAGSRYRYGMTKVKILLQEAS